MRIGCLILMLACLPARSQSVCSECHADIAKSYAETGMARAFAKASAASVPLTTNPYNHAASDTYFAIVRKGTAFLHRRWQKNAEGGEINVEELEIHYVMGSGNHARTFLHRNARAELIELPLGWYAENGGSFAMNPGFDSAQPATRRKIDFDCMSCHNAYPRISAQAAVPGAEPRFTGTMPQGIDCQRCHGSGTQHVATAKRAGSSLAAIRAAIVNPSRLPSELQTEVCMQCHLETTSARLPSLIRRFEKPPFSFKPGSKLANYWLHFDHAPASGHEEKFEIVNAVYRMRQSACFQKSSAMTCTTCHNPHSRSKIAQTNEACTSCHRVGTLPKSAGHAASADCTSCHMPKRRTEDAVHVIMTDHKIRRRPIEGDPRAPLAERHGQAAQYQGEVVPYYPPSVDALYLATAQVLHGSNLEAGVGQLEKEIAAQQPKEAEFYVTLGNAWQQLRRPDKAGKAFLQAVRRRPGSARERRYLGIALMESGQKTQAANAFHAAIRLDPTDGASWYQLALLDSEAGRHRDAADKAAKAIELDPDLLDAYNSLGVNRLAMGDTTGAETALRDALRVNPYFATAHGNLGRLLGSRGDLVGSLSHFAKAVELREDFATDRYDYAITLVRANRFAEAMPQAQAAVRLSPEMADARILLGGLLARGGQMSEARHEYEAVLRNQPENGRAHLDLARILIAQGDRASAVAHLRLAVKGNHEPSAKLASQALSNLGESTAP